MGQEGISELHKNEKLFHANKGRARLLGGMQQGTEEGRKNKTEQMALNGEEKEETKKEIEDKNKKVPLASGSVDQDVYVTFYLLQKEIK
ncbi:hypothetical protein RFI_39130 [Reticulomyxa filosa]|uniref:Uncharacterized protein n=1 Tax=Reticulomyxa filosa TaxID=46433 RepID=X6LBA1_RETFI|nr:hypothetical protein RFI_39130 [Reticulomyxa filosa]|eukprot:ETN98381.1 hypothetical protein RFI_39130 [Reticulomyxa filosa]